jgi:hypothetical protein
LFEEERDVDAVATVGPLRSCKVDGWGGEGLRRFAADRIYGWFRNLGPRPQAVLLCRFAAEALASFAIYGFALLVADVVLLGFDAYFRF